MPVLFSNFRVLRIIHYLKHLKHFSPSVAINETNASIAVQLYFSTLSFASVLHFLQRFHDLSFYPKTSLHAPILNPICRRIL